MSRHVVSNAIGKHASTIIFLHGLGDTGHGWSSTINSIKPNHAKSICPTADIMPVSLNGGFPMPSWFDLYSLDANGPVDEAGIEKAKKLVHGLIQEEEKAGIPSDKIILGGFSQGGALALYSALTYPKPIAGIVALSCWIPCHEKIPTDGVNFNTPTLQCHGDADQVVQLKLGKMTAEFLKKHMTNYQFKVYPRMQHSSNDEELRDVKNFIKENLK